MTQWKLLFFTMLIVLFTFIILSCDMFRPADIKVTPASRNIEKFEALSLDIELKRPFENPLKFNRELMYIEVERFQY